MYNKYAEDLQKYLVAKFPYADASTLTEVAEYITNRTIRLTSEAILDRDKDWKQSLKRY